MNIILIGHKGCGKSSVGKCLAKRLAWAFIDTDACLLEKFSSSSNGELFNQLGEKKFREEEAKLIQALTCEKTVIATGGGAVFNPITAEHLKRLGKMIYLQTSLENLQQRKSSGVLKASDDYAERHQQYLTLADQVVDTNDKTVEDVIEEVLRGIRCRPD